MIAPKEMISTKEVVIRKVESVKELATTFRRELLIYRRIFKDPRTPKLSRVLFGCAALYAVAPIDLIPDVLPVVGQVDDAFVIATFVTLGLAFLPEGLVHEHRVQWAHEEEAKRARGGRV